MACARVERIGQSRSLICVHEPTWMLSFIFIESGGGLLGYGVVNVECCLAQVLSIYVDSANVVC